MCVMVSTEYLVFLSVETMICDIFVFTKKVCYNSLYYKYKKGHGSEKTYS